MPACSFSRIEFVPMILELRKPHTIRRRRKNPIKAEDVLTLYYKQRTSECRAIALTVVKTVTPVVIYPFEGYIKKNGYLLNRRNAIKLTWHDGFDDPENFFNFFQQYNRPVLDDFELIEWNTDMFINLWSVDYFQKLIRKLSAKTRLEWLQASLAAGEAIKRGNIVLPEKNGE